MPELLGHLRAATSALLADPGRRWPCWHFRRLKHSSSSKNWGVPLYVTPGAVAEHLDRAVRVVPLGGASVPRFRLTDRDLDVRVAARREMQW